MAKFQGQVITKQGSNLLARALAGEGKFIFTKGAFGSLKHTEDLEDITNLKSLKLNLNVIKIFNDDGDVVLTLHVTNEHLSEGFLTNEFGIFAKLEGDKEEILYSYAIAIEPDSIPANSFGTTYETTTEIYMNFASNIETDIHVREGAVFLTEPKADEIYVKNEYPVHGNLKSKTQLKAGHIYFDDLGNFYLNTGGERTWNNSSIPDSKLIKVTFKTIYNWITEIISNVAKKEPIISKKTGFNLDKTDLTENNSNKLFTAKGALDLFNKLTSAISTAVEAAKTALRADIVKKIDKTAISSSLTSTSTATVASSAAVKSLEDKKIDIEDAWEYKYKPIGDTSVTTDLNNITKVGRYNSASNAYLFTNKPSDIAGAFLLEVESIQPSGVNYITQTIKSYSSNIVYRRVTSSGTSGWFDWIRIDGNDKVSKSGDVMSGNLTVNGDILVKTPGKKIIGAYGYGYSLYDKNGSSKFLSYIDSGGTIQIGYGADNTPINFQKAPTILNSAVITANEFNVGTSYLGNVNANNLITPGVYGIHGTYATPANNIPVGYFGYLETKFKNSNGNDVVQEFTNIGGEHKYRRYRNNGNWSSWVSLKDYLPLTGGTLTGNVVINSAKPYLELKINGTRHMLIGITNSNNDDVVWSASNHGTHIMLKSDRVYTNRNIYINNDRVATETWVNTNRTWANLSGKPAFNNTVTSTSINEIATPNAVKTAYDRGSAALTEAGKKLPLSGGTINGNLNVTGSLKENGNQVFHKGNILRKVWSGNFRATSNGQTICTLPSDWEICFVQFSDRNDEGYLSTSTIFKKHGATYSWIDHEEEISLRIENNVTLKQMTNDSKGDGRIRAVYVI